MACDVHIEYSDCDPIPIIIPHASVIGEDWQYSVKDRLDRRGLLSKGKMDKLGLLMMGRLGLQNKAKMNKMCYSVKYMDRLGLLGKGNMEKL